MSFAGISIPRRCGQVNRATCDAALIRDGAASLFPSKTTARFSRNQIT